LPREFRPRFTGTTKVTAGIQIDPQQSNVAIEERVQSFLVSHRELKRLLIPGNDKHLAHTVQQHRAATAMREVAFDLTAQLSIHIALNIAREVLS
jgi:hypothetical protein